MRSAEYGTSSVPFFSVDGLKLTSVATAIRELKSKHSIPPL
jgi:hypothetical protein